MGRARNAGTGEQGSPCPKALYTIGRWGRTITFGAMPCPLGRQGLGGYGLESRSMERFGKSGGNVLGSVMPAE